MTTDQRLIAAVLYALQSGCLFPVPEPRWSASVDEWIRWGAMRNLHTAAAEHFRADAPEPHAD